jgi:hypothetical protein
LYDYLRPRIIHENRIEVLSELCNIFQLHIIRDLEGAGNCHFSHRHMLGHISDSSTVDMNKGRNLAFSYLVRNILQDTQGRLVFRAESYIHNDIEKYVPNTSDLDYPNILQSKLTRYDVGYAGHTLGNVKSELTLTTLKGTRKSSIMLSPPVANDKPTFSQADTPAIFDVAEDSDGSVAEAPTDNDTTSSPTPSSIASPPNAFTDNNVAWFPTLQRTLWILSKLYRCVRVSSVCFVTSILICY